MKTKLIVHPHELDTAWIDKMTALGVDTLGIHPAGGQTSHENVANDLAIFESPDFQSLVDYAHAKGLSVAYELHAARYLLPSALFSTHPDWFRMNEQGERVADFNFCVTNTEAMEFISQRAIELTERLYGSAKDYFLWLDDVSGRFCHCPTCRTLSPSDQNLTAMNAIVTALRKKDPHARLAYLAYYEGVRPPTRVKPADGIFLEYAPFERYYPRQTPRPINDDDRAELEALLAVFEPKDAWILEYWFDNSYYTRRAESEHPIPFCPDNDHIKREMQWYVERGVGQLSSFACFLGKSYQEKHGTPDLSAFNKKNIGEYL